MKVTDRCSQDCFHCVNDDGPGHGGDLDADRFVRRLAQWGQSRRPSSWEITEVRITGGEPLMNLPAVLAVGRACQRLGIRSGINTNASLLDRTVAAAMKEAGLGLVKASLDTLDPDTFRRMRGPEASLDGTLDRIRAAVAEGFRVVLRLTLCAWNRRELIGCYRAARAMGAAVLQIKPLVHAGRAVHSEAFLTRDELRRAFDELAAAVEGPAARPEILCWPQEDGAGLDTKACGSMNKVYFTARGEALICNYLPCARPFGTLQRHSLEELFSRRRPKLERSRSGESFLAGCPQWQTPAGVELP